MIKFISALIALSVLTLSADARAGLLDLLPDQSLSSNIKQNGDTIVFDKGNNHVEFKKDFEIEGGEFRVFGITPNPYPDSPIGYIDVTMGLITLSRDRAIFKQSGPQQCEMLAAKEMKTFSVLFANDAIKSQFLSYQDKPREGHFALRLTGTMMKKTKDLYKGQSMEGMTASGPIDPNSVILLTKAAIVPW